MSIFKWMTGLPCPGCGMTRACLHVLSGNFEEAFYYHPLFWLVPIVFGIVIFQKYSLISKIYHSKLFWSSVLSLVVGVYIYRMLQFFPNQAPMDFETQAWIPRLFATLWEQMTTIARET
jgi:hypothetical protein